jgi:hypothetical protein
MRPETAAGGIMKRLSCLALALCLLFGADSAFALGYKQHFDNKATFETMKEAHANGATYLSSLTGKTFVPDPALDTYPQNSTFIYRSANLYTCNSAAFRMNTNILVYADKAFATKDQAFQYLRDLGLIEIIDKAAGSVTLVTPIDPKAGFGTADQYAYFQLQAAMCNLGYTAKVNDKTVYYADNTYFGGLTYRYLIGVEGGSTFLSNFIASSFDDVTRVAAMLLIRGDMEKVRKVASFVPAYLVNVPDHVAEKYKAADGTDAWGYDADGDSYFFNQAQPLRKVVVSRNPKVDSSLIGAAYYGFMVKYMRLPVVKANLYSASTLYGDYKWNQAPYSLGERNAVIDGKTADGIYVDERRGDRFKSIKQDNGEYLDTWFEFLPAEVKYNTAPKGSVPLILGNHGGGDDPLQYADNIGLLTLAGKERFAMVVPEQQSIAGIRGKALTALVRYMLATYPSLDASRVYTTGYSMGGGATFNAVDGDARLFAAAVPQAAVTYVATKEESAQFKDLDIPIMLTTSTYDYFYDTATMNFRATSMCDYPTMLNLYLGFNEMPALSLDCAKYPLSGFKADEFEEITLNDEYVNRTWLLLKNGIPMVGLNVTDFLPHGLYQEYAKVVWDFVKHYSRDLKTGAVVYRPYVD